MMLGGVVPQSIYISMRHLVIVFISTPPERALWHKILSLGRVPVKSITKRKELQTAEQVYIKIFDNLELLSATALATFSQRLLGHYLAANWRH